MSRLQFLSLYKRILRLHKQKLPDLYRSVGDKVCASFPGFADPEYRDLGVVTDVAVVL